MTKKLALVAVLVVALVPWMVIASVARSGLSARVKPGGWEIWTATRLRSLAIPREQKMQKNPLSANDLLLKEAREHFADHCASCHANDGSGHTALGQGLSPQAPDMRLPAIQTKSDGELYSIIHNGIRFSGMPAWGVEGKDDDSWKLVLFIRHLPQLTKDEIRDMEKYNPKSDAERAEEQDEEDFLSGKSGGSAGGQHTHQH
jgi:mono/diheme cytochrome c family protein